MVKTLPGNIALKLEQTLSQWSHWQCTPALTYKPRIVRQLSPGLSNYSILVSGEQEFVVRLDGLNPALIGLSRGAEWRALQLASAIGAAPGPRYYNPELGALVYDYLAPQGPAGPEIDSIAALLRKIHLLPPVHFRLDLAERLLRYEKHIEHRRRAPHPVLLSCREPVLGLIEEHNARNSAPVLCHNDLLRANRLWCAGSLWAIDWEYCAMGSPWFELAVISVGDALSPTETETLLSGYLGREPSSAERRQLSENQSIYRYLELLWFAAMDDARERARQITEARIQDLQRGLNP
jgi:thiamine kinase